MPVFELYNGTVIYTDKDGGAILLPDWLWYPFRYFDDGDLDIEESKSYSSPPAAYDAGKQFFT